MSVAHGEKVYRSKKVQVEYYCPGVLRAARRMIKYSENMGKGDAVESKYFTEPLVSVEADTTEEVEWRFACNR